MIEKRYQVFISSTYSDLLVERQEVLQALLELDCIPSGMELFPAADDDQWTLIQRVIQDCDYYILISAGRYGSIGPGGKSYTQMEYEYAVSLSKPIISFLHKDVSKISLEKSESDAAMRESLSVFRSLAETKLVKYWSDAHELGSVVSRSLIRLIKDRPAVGWVRADALPTEDTNAEIIRLRQIIDNLQSKVLTRKIGNTDDTTELLQGNDLFELKFKFVAWNANERRYNAIPYTTKESIPFSDIFVKIAPLMMDEANERDLHFAIDNLVSDVFSKKMREETKKPYLDDFSVEDDSFQILKVQLVALNLIEKGNKKRPIQDRGAYWKLTEIGEIEMMKSMAIKKPALELDLIG